MTLPPGYERAEGGHGLFECPWPCKATSSGILNYFSGHLRMNAAGRIFAMVVPFLLPSSSQTIVIVPSTPQYLYMKATTQSNDAAGENILSRYVMIFFDGGKIAGMLR
jgi:hypothetical protein